MVCITKEAYRAYNTSKELSDAQEKIVHYNANVWHIIFVELKKYRGHDKAVNTYIVERTENKGVCNWL